MTFKAFSDDDSSLNVAGLSLENSASSIALYGNATFKLDQDSLKAATALHEALGSIISHLNGIKNLPQTAEDKPAEGITQAGNPWGQPS